MTRGPHTRHARVWPFAAIVLAFFAGVIVDGYLRTYGPPLPAAAAARLREETAVGPRPAAGTDALSPVASGFSRTGGEPKISATTGSIPHAKLRVPIDGADVNAWKGGFDERRGGGARGHEAVDILSPRNTPVHAVVSGTIAKIFESKAGGHTIYQLDPDGRLCYYYAHLERYADGIHEGQSVNQGDVIAYVGTSGNAPANTPHLHFAVFELGPDKSWWKGRPLDPYLVFRGQGG